MGRRASAGKAVDYVAAVRAKARDLARSTRMAADGPSTDGQLLQDLAVFLGATPPWQEYLTETDVYRIVFDCLGRLQRADNADSVVVGELLDTRFMEAFGDTLADSLLSIPRSYDVFFELPALAGTGKQPIELCPGVQLLSASPGPQFGPQLFEDSRGLPYKAAFGEHQAWLMTDVAYLVISCRGFADNSINSSAVADAMSRFKQIIQLCNVEGIGLVRRWKPLRPRHREGHVLWVEHGLTPPSKGVPVIPGEDFLSTLGQLEYGENKGLVGVVDDGADTKLPPMVTTLRERITRHQRLLSFNPNDADAERLRAGLEWAFDAAIARDETRAFLYACIGIEALLGDGQGERGGLTEKLADRCAFLLGHSMSNRRELIKTFKAIYTLRSQLVHGRQRRLRQDERVHLRGGRWLLDRVLRAEIQALLTST